MAHAILHAEARSRALAMEVRSAGLMNMHGQPVSEHAQLICKRAGTPMPKSTAHQVHAHDVAWAEIIFVMDTFHQSELVRQFQELSTKIHLLGEFDPKGRGERIQDPVGRSLTEFQACYDRLRDCIRHYLDTSSL
jgi:protein-tyrosine-phosphatase